MEKYYSDEINVQILISLLKEHGIRKVIASPGSANSAFVASVQRDKYFIVYSSVDERSAAYLACGMASESNEPIVISCTGATASRNYLSGLTEAYYRKLPVLAVTSTQPVSRIGHHYAQVIDRSVIPNDVAKLSVTLPIIKDEEDRWDCEIKVNKAILGLSHRGGGPAHINLTTNSLPTFNTKELPKTQVIKRITSTNEFPELKNRKVAIFVGSHKLMTNELTSIIDSFCSKNDAVVFCDHTSNYKGKYRVLYSLVACQEKFSVSDTNPDILIHIGEITGDYFSLIMSGKEVWRVSTDGEIRDTFRKLKYVFEIDESMFFQHYIKDKSDKSNTYLNLCLKNLKTVREKIPELPYSNVWIASQLAERLPEGSTIHFGILNSLRSWNFFELPSTVSSYCNVGGFGIDGGVSSLIGASFCNMNKLFFGVFGDLAFFYDINVLGNRHVGNNLRILLVNNGKGTEFKLYKHHTSHFGNEADEYISAAGHFGNKSRNLVKNFVIDLGFEYMSASNKAEFDRIYERFINPIMQERSIIFEVFTDSDDESKALELIMNIEESSIVKAQQIAKRVLGKKNISFVKRILNS